MTCLTNPEELRSPVQLSIEKKDGTIIPLPSQPVYLQAGSNISFELPEDEDEVTIASEAGAGTEQPYYRQKYNTLATIAGVVNGPFPDPSTGIIPPIPPGKTTWTFSPDSLWISKISNVLGNPVSGDFALVGGSCMNAGVFEELDPEYPESFAASLSIVDICVPCVDCQTWGQLQEYLERIILFYDYIYALVNDDDTTTIPEHPDGGIREQYTGLFQQLKAAQRMWDYLVHRSTVKLAAQSTGQTIVVAGFYRNISEDEIGSPDVTLTYHVSFYYKAPGGSEFCPWGGLSEDLVQVKALDRVDRDSAYIDSYQFLSGGITPPCTSFIGGAHTIEVVMKIDSRESGEEVYGDFALLFTDIDRFNDAGEYLVEIQLHVEPVHLDPPGYDEKATTVYFLPPKPEEGSSSA